MDGVKKLARMKGSESRPYAVATGSGDLMGPYPRGQRGQDGDPRFWSGSWANLMRCQKCAHRWVVMQVSESRFTEPTDQRLLASTSTRGEAGSLFSSQMRGPQRICVAGPAPSQPCCSLRRAAWRPMLWLQVAWRPGLAPEETGKDRCSAPDNSGLRGTRDVLSQTRVTSRSPLIQTGKDRTMQTWPK